MMNVWSCAKKAGGRLLTLIGVVVAMASCHSIYDDEGDCSFTYRVQFRYDLNMKFADAFANEVKAVTLYVIDESGTVVWKRSEQGEALAARDYAMTVDVPPGTYQLLAWCGLEDGSSFIVPDAQPGLTRKEALTCTMVRSYGPDERAYRDKDLKPLFHGALTHTFTDAPGVHTVVVPLTKNTNNVRVVLQHLSGDPVDKDEFTFCITDENGRMAWDNSLLSDGPLTYYAWHVDGGTAELDQTREVSSFSAVVAELSTNRLMLGSKPRLTVTNRKGEKVLSIPLIDYALLVKGYYKRPMDDQEYLDRQDEYSMVFFLDEGMRWVKSTVIINSWKLVLQETDI